MTRPTILDQIRALDPEHDHQRIVFLSSCYEFPFDTRWVRFPETVSGNACLCDRGAAAAGTPAPLPAGTALSPNCAPR